MNEREREISACFDGREGSPTLPPTPPLPLLPLPCKGNTNAPPSPSLPFLSCPLETKAQERRGLPRREHLPRPVRLQVHAGCCGCGPRDGKEPGRRGGRELMPGGRIELGEAPGREGCAGRRWIGYPAPDWCLFPSNSSSSSSRPYKRKQTAGKRSSAGVKSWELPRAFPRAASRPL